MTATQNVALTIDVLIKELLEHGTVYGCQTLKQIREERLGLLFLAQEENIDPDYRVRQLAGIALSKNITITVLGDQEHARLVRKIREALADAVRPEEEMSGLIYEIMSFDAS